MRGVETVRGLGDVTLILLFRTRDGNSVTPR